MTGLFDVDLIPRILSVDKKVRLSGIDKRREKDGRNSKGNRLSRSEREDAEDQNLEKEGTINVTV